eukprot:gene4986-6969_t
MYSGTRRAFPLDSRTVWVEQQHVNNICIPRDNLPIGPGEYSPIIPDRHISTPKLGKYRSPADHFQAFHSALTIETPLNRSSTSRKSNRDSVPYNITKDIYQNNSQTPEYSTIFHNHDKRVALDPNLGFTKTPASYLKHSEILETVAIDGKRKSRNIVLGPNNVPFGERNDYKSFGNEYDIKYESKHIRSNIKNGEFLKSKRIHIPLRSTNTDDKIIDGQQATEKELQPHRLSKSYSAEHINFNQKYSNEKSFAFVKKRQDSIALPNLRLRKASPTFIFNDSSYQKAKQHVPTMTPKLVEREARVNIFRNVYTIPRKHESVKFNSNPIEYSAD